jgi:hypothetical protein
MLEIVWRNPRPPARRTLRVAEVVQMNRPQRHVGSFCLTIVASREPDNEYQLLVNRNLQRPSGV